jgi:hypothetical protein
MKYLFRLSKGTHQGRVCPLAFTISEQATPGRLKLTTGIRREYLNLSRTLNLRLGTHGRDRNAEAAACSRRTGSGRRSPILMGDLAMADLVRS